MSSPKGGWQRASRIPSQLNLSIGSFMNPQTQAHPNNITSSPKDDNTTSEWRWLMLRCERRMKKTCRNTPKKVPIGDAIQDKDGTPAEKLDMNAFTCFVPRTVLEAIADKRITYEDNFEIKIEEFTAAVVFCDASGFTALTEALDKQFNGAERLGIVINRFFDPLIKIIKYWGGDIIKFSGDAVTAVWPVDDEEVNTGDDGAEKPVSASNFSRMDSFKRIHTDIDEDVYRIDKRKACLFAIKCCLDLHSSLHNFPTPIPDKFLALHIGIGFGKVTILQVGGLMDRWDYVVAGHPLHEIAIAEPMASIGETVVSPSVVDAVIGYAIFQDAQGSSHATQDTKGQHDAKVLKSDLMKSGSSARRNRFIGSYCKVVGLIDEKLEPPPPLASIEIRPTDVELLRRYIPPAIFRNLTGGLNVYQNELRRLSVVFICIKGLDVSTATGSLTAHRLMKFVQMAAYVMEGSVNKFLVDDKGVLLLVIFGFPPVYHLDDPIRAVMASMRMLEGMKALGLAGSIGICTGRVWCGTVGNVIRKEYTALGDYVNLAARLMGKAGDSEIFVDSATYKESCSAVEFLQLPSVTVKGKVEPIEVYIPTGNMKKVHVELPLLSWKRWSYRKLIVNMLKPKKKYNLPSRSILSPPLDFPVRIGPLLPHEWFEPYMPEFMNTIDLGGVICILGKEDNGSFEVGSLIKSIVEGDLSRHCFLISNIPESSHAIIPSVPLMAWRKLCTDMVERWRVADNRERKGYSKVDRDNSVYGLTKELTHPSFHWRLEDMKQVIGDLELPSQANENFSRGSSTGSNDSGTDAVSSETGESIFVSNTGESIATVICSMVNEFTMYENTVIALNVRSGTSIFCEMDNDSWKVARAIARLAMNRRRRKIRENKYELKEWRRLHCRNCFYCKGYRKPFQDVYGNTIVPYPSVLCQPVGLEQFKPFVFVLICSDSSEGYDQQQIVEMAKACDSFIRMRNMVEPEAAAFIAHCLGVRKRTLPNQLVNYVYRVSAGQPRFIHLTAKMLLDEKHIRIRELPNDDANCTEECIESNDSAPLNKSLLSITRNKSAKNYDIPDDLVLFALGRTSMNKVFRQAQKRNIKKINDGSVLHDEKKQIVIPTKSSDDTDNSSEDGNQSKTSSIDRFEPEQSSISNFVFLNLGHEPFFFFNAAESEQGLNSFSMLCCSRLTFYYDGFCNVETLLNQPPPPNKFGERDVSSCIGGFVLPIRDSCIQREALLTLSPKKKNQVIEMRVDGSQSLEYSSEAVATWFEKLPFVPALVASCMCKVERLAPEEQIAAKTTSIFICSVTAVEIRSVYPFHISKIKFYSLIESLIKKEVLEFCSNPTTAELQELFNHLVSIISPNPKKNGHSLLGELPSLQIVIEKLSNRNRSSQPESMFLEPKYLRFTSTALQQVISDLMVSEEQQSLTKKSIAVLMKRFR